MRNEFSDNSNDRHFPKILAMRRRPWKTALLQTGAGRALGRASAGLYAVRGSGNQAFTISARSARKSPGAAHGLRQIAYAGPQP